MKNSKPEIWPSGNASRMVKRLVQRLRKTIYAARIREKPRLNTEGCPDIVHLGRVNKEGILVRAARKLETLDASLV